MLLIDKKHGESDKMGRNSKTQYQNHKKDLETLRGQMPVPSFAFIPLVWWECCGIEPGPGAKGNWSWEELVDNGPDSRKPVQFPK